MNIPRYNQDLKLLQEFFGQSNVTWSNKPNDQHVTIRNLALPANVRPNVTGLRILVPSNLYEPAGNGKYHFFIDLYVDPALQVRHADGSWGPVPRHHDAPIRSSDDGWRFLCLHPTKSGTVGPRSNIMLVVRQTQVWFKNCLQLNRNYI